MDRISALRNVEEALRAFEAGDDDLATTQQRVQSVLQSYATEFEDDARRAYRAVGDEPADGIVVVAADPAEAKKRIRALTDTENAAYEIEPL